MKIAVYAFNGVTMFHLAVPQMVFDEVARQGLSEWTTVLSPLYRLSALRVPEILPKITLFG